MPKAVSFLNASNLGALIVKKDPEVKSWEDPLYNINSMAIEEEYGFGIINEGQAIAVARNVMVRPNEFIMPAQSVFNLSEAWSVSAMNVLEIPGFSLSTSTCEHRQLLPPDHHSAMTTHVGCYR